MSADSERVTSELLDQIAAIHSEDEGFEAVLSRYKAIEILNHCRGQTCLDVGSGVGFFCQAVASRFKKVVGIDGSQQKVTKATINNRLPHVSYERVLFEDYNPSETFDFIICSNVLEHVPDDSAFLRRLYSWLSPGGLAVFTVPNARALHKKMGLHMGVIKDLYTLTDDDISKGHYRIYDRESLRSSLKKSGLQTIYESGILLKPQPHREMMKWDPRAVDALYEMGKELPEYCSSLITVAKRESAS